MYDSGCHYFEISSSFSDSAPAIGIIEDNATLVGHEPFPGLGIYSERIVGSYVATLSPDSRELGSFESSVPVMRESSLGSNKELTASETETKISLFFYPTLTSVIPDFRTKW